MEDMNSTSWFYILSLHLTRRWLLTTQRYTEYNELVQDNTNVPQQNEHPRPTTT